MAKHWVLLTSRQYVSQAGKVISYKPGDIVAVGKQTALRWIESGLAEPVKTFDSFETSEDGVPYEIGIVALDDNLAEAEHAASLMPFECKFTQFALDNLLPFEYNVFYNSALHLRKEVVAWGLKQLNKWQCTLIIEDYEVLADSVGSKTDRDRTLDLIHDLRVPLYSTQLFFVRRSDDTRKLMELWVEEREPARYRDERLAMLRAVYQTKPQVLTAPVSWIKGRDSIA